MRVTMMMVVVVGVMVTSSTILVFVFRSVFVFRFAAGASHFDWLGLVCTSDEEEDKELIAIVDSTQLLNHDLRTESTSRSS